MSETLRTDAEEWQMRPFTTMIVKSDFARTLERELSAALARAEKAELAHQSAVDAIKDEIACNHEFMAKGGARHDENVTQFGERLIRERDEARAKADAADKDNAFNVEARIKDADDFRLKLKEERQRLTKAEAERGAALAKLAHYETLRPASEHDTINEALWWNGPDDFVYAGYFPEGTHWTPLPDVKEAAISCGACSGTGWVVRDPDIGTDQECFVCNGSGVIKEAK